MAFSAPRHSTSFACSFCAYTESMPTLGKIKNLPVQVQASSAQGEVKEATCAGSLISGSLIWGTCHLSYNDFLQFARAKTRNRVDLRLRTNPDTFQMELLGQPI